MKPNYALNMTHDGIDLFERNGAEWQVLGTVSLESTDMDGDLTALRHLAERRSPKGLLAKLIIPPSQVLYTRIKAPGPTTAQRKRQISHALDGRTPYAVSDLSFDWSGTGDEVMVAVVARETLQEAEEFARTHGFAALSFVAQPAPDQYAGEPWFGPTAMAAQYLGEGERVERDQDPVRVTGVIALEDPEHDAPEQDKPDAQVDADASPDAHENEAQSEPVAAYDAAEFVAPARPNDQVAFSDPSPILDEADHPADAHPADMGEPLAAEMFDTPADAAPQETPVEAESEAAQVAVTAADAYLGTDDEITNAPFEAALPPEAAPAPEGAPLENTPLENMPLENTGTEIAAVDANVAVTTDPVSAPEARIESPAPAHHWLDSASMELPVEPAETAQPQDTAAEHDGPSLFDAAQDLPEMQVEDVEEMARALPEAELPPLTAVTPQAPEPVAAQDKPILARPTFATRHASAAPKPESGPVGGIPTPPARPERAEDSPTADPSLALPPAQPLSPEMRAAIPRVTPKPTRIDLPKSRLTPPSPQEPRASRLPTLNTKRATDAMNLTLAKAAASGATLSKAAQSAAQLATKLARRGGKKPNSAAASSAQNPLRRDAQPILSRGTPAPLTANAASDPGQETTPLAPSSHVIEPSVAPALNAGPSQPATRTWDAAAIPAAETAKEPLTDAPYHAVPEETRADAPIAASVSAPYSVDEPFPQDAGAKNGAFAQDEAPFAADVEPLSDTSAAYPPAASKRKRSVFGAPLASSTKPSRFLMAKLIAVLFLFMGGVALWASYLGGEDSTEIAQSAPSSGASLPVPDPILPTSEPSPEATEPTPESLAPTAEDDATQEASTDLSEPDVATGETVAQTPVTPDAQPQAPTTTAPPLAQDRLTALATPPSVEGGAPAGLPTTDLTQAEPRQAEPTQAEIAPIIPTESGTVTPSGAVIYAGRPSVTPPARPQSVVTAAEEAAAAAAFPNADPALKGKRPRARPQSVSDAATKAANEAAVTPEIPQIEVDPTDVATAQGTSEPEQEAATAATQTAAAQTETPAPADAPELSAEEQAEIATLLSKRPKARPAAINTAAQRAEAAAKAEAEAAAKAEEEARIAAEEEAKRFADASAQAVETSRRPAAKPRNIAAAVEAAVAAAVAATPREAPAPALVAAVAPAPTAAPAPAAPAAAPAATYTPSPAPKPTVMNAPKTQERAAAIDELDEPEPTAPTSRGATPASVAKQATEKNALNLGKVNLIGLFGSKSNRRALVRMSNGSFVRVKVGDRLDGGQVTAIGDGQLSYQKGGRNTTLKLLAGG